jgi:hypothetical protein
MAQRVEVRFIDDLDGTEIPAGRAESVRFALDGTTYEIDLSAKNAAALRKTLAVYVAGARRLSGSRAVPVRRIEVGSDNRTIKAWARANGYQISNRGRIPAEVRTAFAAAN